MIFFFNYPFTKKSKIDINLFCKNKFISQDILHDNTLKRGLK